MLRWLIAGYLVLTVLLVGLKFGLQTSAEERSARYQQQQVATRSTAHAANALLVLTQEYILRGSIRSAGQWEAAHRVLAEAVLSAAPAMGQDMDSMRSKTSLAICRHFLKILSFNRKVAAKVNWLNVV